jgi:hypothetical protein
MPERKIYDLFSVSYGEGIFQRDETARATLDGSFECFVEVVRPSHWELMYRHSQRVGYGLHFFQVEFLVWVGGVPQDCDPRQLRKGVFEQFQPFTLISGKRKAKPVMFPPGRARLATNPKATGSATSTITIGIVVVVSLAARVAAGADVTMRSTLRRINSEGTKPLLFSIRRSVLNDHVPPLHVAVLAKALAECFDVDCWRCLSP